MWDVKIEQNRKSFSRKKLCFYPCELATSDASHKWVLLWNGSKCTHIHTARTDAGLRAQQGHLRIIIPVPQSFHSHL